MKNTWSALLLSVTIVFLAFCSSIAAPPPSSGNSSNHNASNNSNASTGQALNGHIASLKEKFPSEEEWLKACLAQAIQVNYELIVYKKGLSRQLVDTKKEIETVKRKNNDSVARTANLKEKQEEVDRIVVWSNTKLEAARKELEAQQYVAAEATKSPKNEYAAKLKSEVKTMKSNIAEMEKKSHSFASLSTNINAPPPTKKKTK